MTHGYGIIFYLLSTNLNSWRRGSISSKNSNIYKVSYLQYETCIADTIRYGSFSNFRNELNESVTPPPHTAHSDEPKWIYRRVCNNQHLTRWGRGGGSSWKSEKTRAPPDCFRYVRRWKTIFARESPYEESHNKSRTDRAPTGVQRPGSNSPLPAELTCGGVKKYREIPHLPFSWFLYLENFFYANNMWKKNSTTEDIDVRCIFEKWAPSAYI